MSSPSHLVTLTIDAYPNGYHNGEIASRAVASEQLSAPLRILQIFGFFPRGNLKIGDGQSRCTALSATLIMVTAVFLLVNLLTFSYMFWVFTVLLPFFGFINILTVCCIINGFKPLQNVLNLLIIGYRYERHVQLLQQLDRLDNHFRSQLGYAINLRLINLAFIVVTLTILLLSLFVSSFQFHYRPHATVGPLDVAALLLSPTLCIWQLLPLMYFALITKAIRMWSAQLCLRIKLDIQQSRRSLPLYCDTFAMLTRSIQLVGKLFNPFILVSLSASCVVFCFAINFIVNAENIFGIIGLDLRVAYFNVVWGVMHTTIAALYIFIICVTGFKTNEKARKVVATVVMMRPDNVQEQLMMTSLNARLAMQNYIWGLSVWRAMPLERTFLFSVISIIVTYAALLVKMKDKSQAGANCLCNGTSEEL